MNMRLPVGPTLLVAVALPALIGLGLWQLERRDWKNALMTELAARQAAPLLDLSRGGDWRDLNLRRVRVDCSAWRRPARVRGGDSATGDSGFSYRLDCQPKGMAPGLLEVVVGWATRPDVAVTPTPGAVTGIMVARQPPVAGAAPWVLVAATGTPPLAPVAPPSTETIANNHLSYAVQWFGFAATLGVIYAVYVRRWRRQRG